MKNMLRKKKLILLCINIIGFLIAALLLINVQISTVENRWNEKLSAKCTEIKQRVKKADDLSEKLETYYNRIYTSKAKTAAFIIRHSEHFNPDNFHLSNLRERLGVTNLFIADNEGNVLFYASMPVTSNISRDRFNALRTVFLTDNIDAESTPFEVDYSNALRRYYAARIDENTEIIVEQNPEELKRNIEAIDSNESILKKIKVGVNGFVFAVSATDYTFSYFPEDNELIGTDALVSGLKKGELRDGFTGWIHVKDKLYYSSVMLSADKNAFYIAAVPVNEIIRSSLISGIAMLTIFLMISSALSAYVYYVIENSAGKYQNLKSDSDGFTDHKRMKLWAETARKAGVMNIFGLLFFIFLCVYIQALFSTSNDSITNLATSENINNVIYENVELEKKLEATYDENYLNKCEVAAYLLGDAPELKEKQVLTALSKALGVYAIHVFDDDGSIVASSSSYENFTLSNDPNSQSYEFRRLLNGTDYVIQNAQPDDLTGSMLQYIGVSIKDSEGFRDGFVQIAVLPDELNDLETATSLDNVLADAENGINGLIFSVDKETLSFSYFPEKKYIGKLAADYGIKEEYLKDGYENYISVDGENYFGKVIETENEYVFVVLKNSGSILIGFDKSTAYMVIIAFIISIAIFAVPYCERYELLSCDFKKNTPADSDNDEKGDSIEAEASNFDVNVNGVNKSTQSVSSRWSLTALPWSDMTPEEKLSFICKAYYIIIAVLVCIQIFFGRQFLDSSSILLYIINKKWERNFNIFSITASIMFISVMSVFLLLFRSMLKSLAKSLGSRGATICQLFRSFIKYITWVVVIYYCLTLFGANPSALLASAGLLTAVIGFGAQNVIGDILAGLFIIFEGEFRVGDIVTIGDWRGKVLEIGVRTTKIESIGNDVKIFANSAVTGVINMTRRSSCAIIDVGIDYGESLERVEAILAEELPKLKTVIPAIIEGPYYSGVSALGESAVIIEILAYCDEQNRVGVQYMMNRAIKLIFDEHDIVIPYPNVTVNEPHEQRMATWIEKYRAEKFVNEQSIKSKKAKAKIFDRK